VSLDDGAVDQCILEIGTAAYLSENTLKTPASAHLRKRRNTLFQLPNGFGRSRHGNPVRTRHKTASRNNRLSLPVAPLSPGLPGKSGLNRTQTSSEITNLCSSIQTSLLEG
jgi:hypothetical protein